MKPIHAYRRGALVGVISMFLMQRLIDYAESHGMPLLPLVGIVGIWFLLGLLEPHNEIRRNKRSSKDEKES